MTGGKTGGPCSAWLVALIWVRGCAMLEVFWVIEGALLAVFWVISGVFP